MGKMGQNVTNVKEKQINDYFIGMTVITDYGDTFRRYRIEGVDLNLSPDSEFPDKKFKSYKEYFLKRYNKKITVTN